VDPDRKGWRWRRRRRPGGIKVAAASVAIVVVGSGAAFAATIPGTDAGEALHGTRQVDKIYGYGADLVYGYGGADSLYGGNEAGWVDRILGGSGGDRPLGQNGHDALYGERGNDELRGGFRDHLCWRAAAAKTSWTAAPAPTR